MTNFLFWRSWTLSERRAVSVVLTLVVISLISVLAYSGLFSGNTPVKWDVISRLTDIQIPANYLELGSFTFEIPAPSVSVTEQYVAPLMVPDPVGSILFLVVALLGLSLASAALTSLSRFWYLGGTAIFILLLVFSRMEVLVFQGLPERVILVLSLLLYVGVGYYFHAFRSHIGLVTRVLCFGLISIGLLVLIHFASSTPDPVYAFLAYSLPLWLVPTIIFLVISATEIIYGLVWLTTSKATSMGKRALPNLAVMLVIYLLILIFAYAGNTKMAEWGVVLVPVYLLGGAAALIGVFGFKARCEASDGHLSFRGTGVWLYNGLFLIAIGMTGMALVSDNDPLLEVLEDTVVNAQLGMGAAFVFYLIANFLPLLRQGLQVHKVLYKPMNFGLAKSRIIGFGIVLGLFSMQNLFPVKQGIAGYFSGLGDWHAMTGQYVLAEQYYKMSLQHEFQNHKANYALASLARVQGDQTAAVFYFRQATLKKPSPQAYIGLAHLLAEDNLYFEAMFSLKEGRRAFPANAPILNNLGLLYAKTNLSDSAFYFLQAAREVVDDDISATNILATLSGVLDPATLDSLAAGFGSSAGLSLEANQLLVRNLVQRFEKIEQRKDAVRGDSLLSAGGFAYWLNYAYNQARLDTTVAEKIRGIAGRNSIMTDELLLASAHADFYGGNKTRALESLLALSTGDDKKYELYRNILGHWFLQLGLYEKAIDVFSVSSTPEGVVGHAIAQSLSGNPVNGIIVLEKLRETGTDSTQLAAIQNAIASVKIPGESADSLLAVARKAGTEAAFLQALRANPYHPGTVAAVAEFYKEKNKDLGTAYKVVVNALRFNEKSALLWEYYSLLNLDMGLTEQAEEGKAEVRLLTDDAAYHDFSTRYQAKWSLKQKEREEF